MLAIVRPATSEPRRPFLRRASLLAALAVGALLMTAGVVWAALPPKGATFTFHDHATAGREWHVDLRIHPKDRTKVKTLVLYSELCGETVAEKNVPISDAGVVSASGPLADGGSWAVVAEFKERTTVAGVMRITRPGCDTGALSFPNEITGDGHADHDHEEGHEHGPKYADFRSATRGQRRQAAALHRRVLRRWADVSFAEAKGMGFRRNPRFEKKLGVFHVYKEAYEEDERILDAKRPESLVFWRQPKGPPVLLGAMFRVAPGKPPAFAGPIPIYHSHSSGKPTSQMTHVWLVEGVKMAWANCLPTEQLHEYNPAFESMADVSVGIAGTC